MSDGRRLGGQSAKHKSALLRRVYPRIGTLERLIDLLRSAPGGPGLIGELVKPNDHQDYVRLLRDSLANPDPGAPPVDWQRSTPTGIHQVVDRAIEAHLWSGSKGRNVLCLGFRKCVGGSGERSASATGLNGVTASLKGAVWELLLRRIGGPLLTHLLLHCSIFVPLPNGCHLQVCGRPIGDVVYAKAWVANHAPKKKPAPRQSSLRARGSGTKRPDPASQGLFESASQASDAESELPPSNPGRPSSWQRRRAAKSKAAREAEGGVAGPSLATGVFQGGEEVGCSGGEAQPAQLETAMQPYEGRMPVAAALTPTPPSQPPGNSARPSLLHLKVPRQGAFYNAVSCKPGLPKSCLLSKAMVALKPAMALYAVLMNADAGSAPGWRTRGRSQLPAQLPPLPKHVPKCRRRLLGIMRQIIVRARKCPFGMLLRKHCPLPQRPVGDESGGGSGGPAATSPGVLQCAQPSLNSQPTPSAAANASESEEAAEGPSDLVGPGGSGAAHEKENLSLGSQGGQEAPCRKRGRVQAAGCGGQNPKRQRAQGSGGPVGSEEGQSAAKVQVDGTGSQSDLLKACVPHDRVTAFVWAVVRKIIPPAMLGSAHNRRALRGTVERYISLRRHENMNLQQAARGIRTSELPFLRRPCPGRQRQAPLNQALAHQRMLCRWLLWLLGHLVLPLLRANFYVTESEAYRYQVFYYRKPVWKRLRQMAVKGLMGQFSPIPSSEACNYLKARQLGVTRHRFLPKRTGMRAIANLSTATAANFPGWRLRVGPRERRRCGGVKLAFKPINSMLQNLHQVLKLELRRQPGLLGSSVFGYDDVYRAYKPFVRQWRAVEREGTPLSPCVLTADVSRAFDAIDVSRLLPMVLPLLRRPEYHMVKYAEVVPSVGSTARVAHRVAAVEERPGSLSFPRLVEDLAQARGSRAFMDKVSHSTVGQKALQDMLAEHLLSSISRFGKMWHIQTKGLPQGSTLSTLLCSMYLASLEQRYLLPLLPHVQPVLSASTGSAPGLTDLAVDAAGTGASGSGSCGMVCFPSNSPPGDSRKAPGGGQPQPAPSVSMRLVDDFVFVTHSLTAARALAARLQSGFPDFGITINAAKTRASFPAAPGQQPLQSPLSTPGGDAFIPWCGLLINCASLELQADYTRYSGQHLSTALVLNAHQRPRRVLAAKLRSYLRPKCHPLLLDSTINSPATIRLNIYQMVLLAAMKFHCAAMCMEQQPPLCWHSLLAAIRGAITYLQQLIRERAASAERRLGSECRMPISGCHIKWLALHAFLRVLGRKQSRYRPVLAALREEMRGDHFARLPSQLAAVVDPKRSPAFDTILY